ncbi:hypothetical protein SDC9_149401 [bioreactor metagenome]|uniref:Uncharacterized protein n=1 Tax=bioreactor metagenome TaxID=1076179 RepID=A0A645EK90_9ZZZZ
MEIQSISNINYVDEPSDKKEGQDSLNGFWPFFLRNMEITEEVVAEATLILCFHHSLGS